MYDIDVEGHNSQDLFAIGFTHPECHDHTFFQCSILLSTCPAASTKRKLDDDVTLPKVWLGELRCRFKQEASLVKAMQYEERLLQSQVNYCA